jgi:hypothetical protein
MSGHGNVAFPKGALWGAAALISFTLSVTVAVRAGVFPHVANPPTLRATILPASEQGFVRGVLRGLARERRLKDVGPDAPFRLEQWSDNGLTLTDLGTGRQIELGAFGSTNRAAFAVMLPQEPRA